MASTESGGRRHRNMREKHRRIFVAAAELFAERGFEGVTAQEIADRADVATGTLFRYAASKSELLLMVYNEQFRAALDEGERSSRGLADTVDAVVAMVTPTVVLAGRTEENGVRYQRELMFGSATEQYRGEGLALVARLEQMIARRLSADSHQGGRDADQSSTEAVLAGRTAFAIVHLAAVRASTSTDPGLDPAAELRQQLRQVILGYRESRTQKQ